MSITLSQSKTAIAPGLTASFLAFDGTPPYVFEVLPGGVGGSIDSEGVYTAPAVLPDSTFLQDVITATDDNGDTAYGSIFVGGPLLLFCEILQRELGLPEGNVYLWDQKLMQPRGSELYIVVSIASCKPFANNIKPDPVEGWSNPIQIVNMLATLDLDIISRGPAARDHKEEVILALNSLYSQAQQEANSFYIGKLPAGAKFINLSMIDGAAIPYRFRISVNVHYAVTKQNAVPYFDTFSDVTVTTNP